MKRFKTVEGFFESIPTEWKNSLVILRRLLNESGMEETVKWGMPVYTVGGKNVAGIGFFKAYAGLWFFNGSFLSDPAKKLINAQEGKTQGMRQWRFQSSEEIDVDLVMVYLREAIENQKDGKELKPIKKELVIPDELDVILSSDKTLKQSFESLGLSKKREFADYITDAKREDTKKKRLEKIVPLILEKKGLNDKYK
jgi:uncharacterized protein YdeI (YjbR/CyaY-like superfamily)